MPSCQPDTQHPHVTHNAHPKMRYEITLTIKDAPGLFDSVTGSALYEVTNEKCSPFSKFMGIYRPPSIQDNQLLVTQVSDHEYVVTTYLDLMKDEDYYDLGVCHWAMNQVIFRLKAGGAEFIASILRDEIISQQPTTIYLLKEAYLHRAEHSSGNSMLLNDMVRQHPDRFFPVTLTAREQFE